MSTAETFVEMYTNLGFLFYSIAAGDGQVRQAEVDALNELVRKQWMPLESSRDEFGVDAAEYISMSFDYARDNKLDAEQAFQRFEDAYQEHVTMFDPGLKRMVLDTATAITDAFGHTNKAELAVLTRLQSLFRE
ncbi:MAG: TerB family tellurite resistance protein [Flavobacteriales bacterium]|nr:TerB family tellurite resistance protein [Flavobacteriales bacterium]HPF91186.1 TerB family tellurite resistance protein [Flavobacteriales bacterium]